MPSRLRHDCLWSRLVWPLLWPLLLAQLALVLLCLVVALFLWRGTPTPSAWSAWGWLLLALLVGTTLTTTAFLLQLRHRLADFQAGVDHGLERLERRLPGLARWLPDWLPPPSLPTPGKGALLARLAGLHEALDGLEACRQLAPDLVSLLASSSRPGLLLHRERIVSTNRAMEQLLGESSEALRGADLMAQLCGTLNHDGEPGRIPLRDAQGRWRQLRVERLAAQEYALLLFDAPDDQLPQLGGLVAARERAREDSRLKSRYLALLQRELVPLLTELSGELESRTRASAGGVDARRLAELRARMADVTLLVSSLAGDREASLPPGQAAPTLRVLIVDDGPVNRMLASQVLEGQGIAVDSVASGGEALACRLRHTYDLVFMDIFMPDMDGVETARRWRALEADERSGARSVLVALTANASEEDRRRFREAGMDDYLAKPYRPGALLDMLHHWRPTAFEASLAP
jgi:CheY-like chemotaxis protein/PAS domain-containing protein